MLRSTIRNSLRNVVQSFQHFGQEKPTPVAARSKALVYGRSIDGITGSNVAGGMDICLL
jgi:hypothetical protein